jgi:sensor histidine kinase regulating citrate/malate metabolism
MGVVGFFALQYLLSVFFFSDYKEVQKIIFITLAFMVLFFSAILLVLSGQEKMRIKTKENEMVESELRITQERNEQLIETYKEIAKNSHDFKNQMRVTLLMLKNGDISEAQKYLSNVVEVAAESTTKYTGILSIDTVLSEKTRIAAKNGIKLELDVSLSTLCGIDAIDICTILLNLIDNAVEASLKITDETKRYVKIILKNVNSMVFLKVENSFDENSIQPSVEKKNKSMHGYGLKIVNSIAEKHNGSVVTQSEDGRFVATVLI